MKRVSKSSQEWEERMLKTPIYNTTAKSWAEFTLLWNPSKYYRAHYVVKIQILSYKNYLSFAQKLTATKTIFHLTFPTNDKCSLRNGIFNKKKVKYFCNSFNSQFFHLRQGGRTMEKQVKSSLLCLCTTHKLRMVFTFFSG